MSPEAPKAKLALYVPFESTYETGFALPIFQFGADRYLVQNINEITGRIESFLPIDTIGSESIRAQSSLEVSAGDYALYSFVNEHGAWHIGTLRDLKPELLRFYNSCSNYLFLNLQIAELVGSREMRVGSRALVYQSVAEKAGYAAARAFLAATLRHSLWSSLMGCALDQQAANDLILCRRRIMSMVDWDEPDLLPSGLWDEIDPFLSLDRQEIVGRLKGEKAALDLKSRPKMIKIYTLDDDVPLEIAYGSTPIDVAYFIHTELGDQTVGATINGRVMPLRTWLREGDRLKILRAKSQTAQPNWLAYVFTHYAYRMIRRSLARQLKAERFDPR